jgi:hypothetical protein
MKLLRILLRTAWVSAGVAAIVAWGISAFMTLFSFLVGYGNPPDTYTGQTDDRQGAWSFLIILTVLSVIIIFGVARPVARWQRRRVHAQGHLRA